MRNKIVLAGVAALSLTGCEIGSNDQTQSQQLELESQKLESELQVLIAQKQIASLQVPENTPSVDSPLVTLGSQLFFSKALSGNLDTSCASCHHPNLGGGDDLSLPIGVEALQPDLLGPGRLHGANGVHHDGGPTVPRNAPTTLNFALYSQSIFHDGRMENNSETKQHGGVEGEIRSPEVPLGENDTSVGSSFAQAQARFPVTSQEEMRGFEFVKDGDNQALRSAIAARLQGDTNELAQNDWLEAFRKGFENPQGTNSELVTFSNITMAIGAYERSQILIDNPWFNYLAGDTSAITDSAKRGAKLFYNTPSEGGFDCASCHSSGFFSDEGFHVVAMPQVGRGKGDGEFENDDFGRFRETKQDQDKYAFRTPTLLNVTETGPWTHSGAYVELRDVVEHHLNPAVAIASFSPDDIQVGIQVDNWQQNTDKALAQLESLQSQGKSKLQTLAYTEAQVDDLMAFLSALTDPCTQTPSCMNKWVPDESVVDPDGLRLIAVDENGEKL